MLNNCIRVHHNVDEETFLFDFKNFALSEDCASDIDSAEIEKRLDEHIGDLRRCVKRAVVVMKDKVESFSTEDKVARLMRQNKMLQQQITQLEAQQICENDQWE